MLYREAPPPCHGLPWLPQLPLASWDPLPPAASLWPAWEGMKVGGLKARADAVCDPGQSPSPLSLSLPICTNRTRAVTSPVPHPLVGFGASAYPPVWAQGPGRSWQAGPPAMFSSRHARGTAGGGLPACPAGPSALCPGCSVDPEAQEAPTATTVKGSQAGPGGRQGSRGLCGGMGGARPPSRYTWSCPTLGMGQGQATAGR